jgi:hypothetical protein
MGDASEKNRAEKSTGTEIWTAIVLTITMVAVVWYTWEADRQNEFTKHAIETASRPYLAVSAREQGFTTAISSAAAGGAIAVVPFLRGESRQAAGRCAHQERGGVQQDQNFSHRRLDGLKEKHRFIFSETNGDALVALDREALTSGQLADIESGIGFIYLAVDDAVRGEPLSTSNSLIIRENAGNFHRFSDSRQIQR